MLRVRDPLLIASALALLCAGMLGTSVLLSWVGKAFPGFLVLQNGVVASAGLASWPTTHGGDIWQHEILIGTLLLCGVGLGAVALRNALALESLREVNTQLESRVSDRTRELNEALGELRDKNKLLTHLSITDPLTGLRNRAYIDDALDREFARARRTGSGLSLLMLDIDHFKQVNDRYGHRVGDMVLHRTAEIIEGNLRSTDIAGRFGGEEFIIILTNQATPDGGFIFGERLRGAVGQEQFRDTEGNTFAITPSVGVAPVQPEHESASHLIAAADAALYRAKSLGRDRTAITVDEP